MPIRKPLEDIMNESLLSPSEAELRAAAIDDVSDFDGDAPMVIENIDFA
ncbi:hypothetical protein GCM10022223_32730 [Kineosporia mesophila]|uniref:Uncharacterized protein n=1 Tax=Kineosporia mesophila TaxID=566012 RepID=A0ABP6ZPJ8_9ACTN